MKKISILLAIFVCLLDVSIVFGYSGPSDESTSKPSQAKSSGRPKLKSSGRSAELGDTDNANQKSSGKAVNADSALSSSTVSKVKKAIQNLNSSNGISNDEAEADPVASDSNGLATLPNGPAYVGVNSSLNLRNGVWGDIIGDLSNNEQVTITGRDGDWYKVSTSKGNGYVYATYIFKDQNSRKENSSSNTSNNSNDSSNNVVLNVSGDSLQGKIVSAAQNLVENYPDYQSFPYADGTEGGNLGCAQVATTALCAAGALSATNSSGGLGYASLAVDEAVDMLKDAGWVTATVPPFQAGDVIAWNDYGHIGIIMTSGNSAQAMHNSSSARKPTYIDAEYFSIAEVLRKS